MSAVKERALRSHGEFSALFGKNVWCVYLYVAMMPDDSTAVKIGITSNPYRRIGDLRVGMPFGAIMLWDFCKNRSACAKTERRLHNKFRGRHLRGEWFRFGTDLAEKAYLHSGVKEVFKEHNGRDPDWKVIDDTNKPKDRLKGLRKQRPRMAFGKSNKGKCRYCDAPLPLGQDVFCDNDCRRKYKID